MVARLNILFSIPLCVILFVASPSLQQDGMPDCRITSREHGHGVELWAECSHISNASQIRILERDLE